MGVLDDAIREHLELKRQHGASDEELTRAEQDALGPARRDQIEEIDPQAMAEPALVPDHIEPLPHGDPLAHHEPPVGDEAYAPPTEFLPPEEGHDDGMEPEFAPIEGQTEIGEEGAMLAGEPIAEFEAAPEAPYDAATEIHTPEPQTHDAGLQSPQLDDNEASHQGDPMAHDAAHEPEPEPAAHYETEEHVLEEEQHVEHHEDDDEHHEPPPPPPAEERNERDDLLEDTPDFLQETPEHDRLWFEQKPPKDFDFDE